MEPPYRFPTGASGFGTVTAISGQTAESYQEENIDCPDCAPVEASGSERDEIARLIWQRFAPSSDMDEANALRGEYVIVADDIMNLRPQPSEETREAVARLAWTYACSSDELDPEYDIGWSRARDLYANSPSYTDSAKAFVDRTWAFADAILALLSARPLALGGQHSGGETETLRVLLDNLVIAQTLSKDLRQKATDEAR